jgi:acyl dehydratase
MSPQAWTLEELVEGTEASFQYLVRDADVEAFAELSGDRNPLHTDPAFSRRAGFRDRVVHGAFVAALASRLVGMDLPGRDSLLLSLRLDFVAPTFPGETVEVTGKVESVHPAERTVLLGLAVTCGGEPRARGSALVRVGG